MSFMEFHEKNKSKEKYIWEMLLEISFERVNQGGKKIIRDVLTANGKKSDNKKKQKTISKNK